MDKSYLDKQLHKNRIIFLGSEINSEIANSIILQLLLYDAEDRGPIYLYINSVGGSVYNGLAVLDAMALIKSPVNTIAIGSCFSMATWLLAAGTKGMRYATPNCRIMIHQGKVMGYEKSTLSDIQTTMKNFQHMEERMIKILSKHTGKTEEEIIKDITRDFYMSPEEAIEYGIIDGVLSPD